MKQKVYWLTINNGKKEIVSLSFIKIRLHHICFFGSFPKYPKYSMGYLQMFFDLANIEPTSMPSANIYLFIQKQQ